MIDVARVLARLGIEFRNNGQHLVARCPYHEDHDPSWRIRRTGERAGLHHCQACKEGGDLVDLVMHVRGYGTRAAARDWLGRHDVVAEDLQVPGLRVRLEKPMREFKMPAGVVFDGLSRWPTPAREEVMRRGIDEAAADTWDLGYAVEGRLAGRVVVPVFDRQGTLKGYMARAFTRAARKYLYPSEEERPDMDVMFGEVAWLAHFRLHQVAVVTEGAFKCIAVDQAVGPAVMVAALGGSPVPPRPAHVAKLVTFGRVVVLTDSDPAGEACGDALVAALDGHVKNGVWRVRLPEGQDADSIPREELRAALWPAVYQGALR